MLTTAPCRLFVIAVRLVECEIDYSKCRRVLAARMGRLLWYVYRTEGSQRNGNEMRKLDDFRVDQKQT